MPEDGQPDSARPNPLLEVAKHLFESVAPGGLNDPEKALRGLVPKLRFLIINQIESPTANQLQALRCFSDFENSNLLQIRNALRTSEVRLGPFPEELAQRSFVPQLTANGFTVSLRELTLEEKARFLEFDD